MEKVSTTTKSCSRIIATILAAIMGALLIFMTLFNEPIADQYDFMNNIHQYGTLGYTGIMYSQWSGRLVQVPILGLMYNLFGDNGAQTIFPIILLLLLAAAFSWVIYQLVKFRKFHAAASISFGLLLASGTLYTASCLFDIYLWLDAAVVYLLGLISIVYNFGVFIWIIKNTSKLRRRKIIFGTMLIITLLLQTAGETSMVTCLGWSFIVLAASFVNKQWRQYRAPLAIFFAAILAGSLIMILSPGLWSRADQVTTEASYFSIFIKYPLSTIKNLILDISAWRAALVVITGVIIGQVLPSESIKRHMYMYLLVSTLVIVSLCYFPTVVYFYGNHAVSIESRALAAPNMGIFVGFSAIVAVLSNYATQKLRQSDRTHLIIFVGIVSLALVIFIPGFLQFNKNYISALVTRENLVDERMALIEKYQKGETNSLSIPDAPIMISNSSATDFTTNGWANVDWFYNSFNRYYNLNPDVTTIHGEPLVLPETKQDWYVEAGRNLCTEGNALIYEKYYCHNL